MFQTRQWDFTQEIIFTTENSRNDFNSIIKISITDATTLTAFSPVSQSNVNAKPRHHISHVLCLDTCTNMRAIEMICCAQLFLGCQVQVLEGLLNDKLEYEEKQERRHLYNGAGASLGKDPLCSGISKEGRDE